MRVDRDAAGLDLTVLPRFQRAPFHARSLLRLATACAVAAAVLFAVSLHPAIVGSNVLWLPLLRNNAAALLLLSVGLQSSWWIARWRVTALGGPEPTQPTWLLRLRSRISQGDAGRNRWLRPLAQLPERILTRLLRILGSETFSAVWFGSVALAVLWLIGSAWNLNLTLTPMGRTAYVVGGVALLSAFILLVQERYFSGHTQAQWPEAQSVAQLTRIAIATLLLSSLCLFFSATPNRWVARLAVCAGVFPAIVAFEIAVRAALSLFVRNSERIEPRLLADSIAASVWRWPPRPLHTLQDELRSRFGIDLRQSWAFAFMRRALLPVLLVIAAIGWLASGIREVPVDGRGIYERFGRPVAVLGPGVHVGLPWLLGSLRAVENGVVHQLATTVGSDEDEAAEPDVSTAEGPAPESANRLWDASHVNEKSQVIASLTGDKQSFQVVNMDVRFVYRVGLTDAAALAATYNSADIPTLIRSTANRVVVQDFASRTIEGVLGEKRLALAAAIRATVQADLDRARSGVEVLATLIEAVHPPAGAANAYHSVQAAQIKAQATIARERGRAAQQINEAQLTATIARDKSVAGAREARANAEVVEQRFAAERNGYRMAGKAFLTEQYLSQLGTGLAKAQVIIVDHRIRGQQAPTIDLRSFTAADLAASGGAGP
jgi:regulator of protease activity HflC (stomatin/prohibitin superfamily)